jgi:hypothetical protein
LLDLWVLLDELADLGSNEEVHHVLERFLEVKGPAVLPELFLDLNETINKLSIHSAPALAITARGYYRLRNR